MTSLHQDLCRTFMQYCCCCEIIVIFSARLRGKMSREMDIIASPYCHIHTDRAWFGCVIDVKSDDRRALNNAEAKDVVAVWKAFTVAL